MSSQKNHATVLFAGLVCTLLSVNNASAATSEEMVQALGIPPELVVAHNLYTVTGTGSSSVELSGEGAALALSDEGAVLISSGLGSDAGLGDTDWGTDGERDTTVFSVTLSVPTDARSLVFRTRFSSREYLESNSLDSAIVSIRVEPCGGLGCVSMPYDLVSVSEALDTVNPTLLRIINTESVTQLQITFQIFDADDGALDSAIRILDFHFSENPPPSPAQFNSELPPEDVKVSVGTYRYQKELLSVPGRGLPFNVVLYYNSAQTWTETLGHKWSHNYEWRLQLLADGGAHIRAGDGGSIYFGPEDVNGSFAVSIIGLPSSSFYSSWSGSSGDLQRHSNGSYTFTNRAQLRYHFNSDGLLTAIEDPNGNRLSFTYNVRNRLATVTDMRGGVATYDYVNQGRQLIMIRYVPADGPHRVIEFRYYSPSLNPAGQEFWDLEFVRMLPDMGPLTFTYDDDGNLETATNFDDDRIIDNSYRGELIAARRDGLGATDSYVYFTDSLAHTDRLGRVHRSVYDSLDRMTSRTDPLDNGWQYSYDEEGNLLSQTDPLGRVQRRTYADSVNLSGITDALGNTRTFEYDSHNNITRSVDALGYATDYLYDGRDNLLRKTDPNGHVTNSVYDAFGQVTSSADRNGNLTLYTYSTTGDLSSITDALGGVVTYDYDSMGNVSVVSDPNGNAMQFVYDYSDRLTGVLDALGNETRYTLNQRNKKTSMTRSNGAVTQYGYDSNGRMTSVTDALGNTFESGYTALGQLASQTDALGRVATFSYDAGDRLVGVRDPLGNVSEASYDAADQRTGVTGPGGSTTAYEYDALGRVIAETDALGSTIRNVYNARGLLSELVLARGIQVGYAYDAAGQLVQTTLPDFVSDHELDSNGNAVVTTGRDGRRIEREFDVLNRLVSRTDPHGRTIQYEYDAAGNLTRLTYSDGASVTYAYDAADRLIRVTDWAGRATTYEWDSVGNLLSTTLPDGSVFTSLYDPVDRLTAFTDVTAAGDTVVAGEYDYNAIGIQTAATEQMPLDPTVVAEPAVFTYDAANRIATRNGENFAYDADGNLTAGELNGATVLLEYDALNQLVRVGEDQYDYDMSGLRIAATINGQSVEYTQDPTGPLSRLLEEFAADGTLIARYVYGLGLIGREGADDQFSIYHYDRRGSTVALTNLNGEVTDRFAYDPWGKLTGRTGSTPNPFTYDGFDGVVDDGNGLYFMRTRYYSPELMRFIQKDQRFMGSLMNPQSLNRYTYALNNPILITDPNGEVAPLLILGAMAVGISTEIAFDWLVTGEFDPFNDPWGPYLEENWVDLSIAAITSVLPVAAAARWVKKFKHAPKLYKFARWGRVGVQWLGGVAGNFLMEYVVFPLLDVKNWTEVAGTTIVEYVEIGVDYLGDAYDWTCQNTSTSACDWVEGAIDDIGDTAEDVGDFISDVWHSIF